MNLTYYSIIYKSHDSNGKVIAAGRDNFENLRIAKNMFYSYKVKDCSAQLVKVIERKNYKNINERLELIIDYKYNY